MTVLAGEVRQGTTPALSALAVVIISISIFGAVLYEVLKRREENKTTRTMRNAKEAERSETYA